MIGLSIVKIVVNILCFIGAFIFVLAGFSAIARGEIFYLLCFWCIAGACLVSLHESLPGGML